MPLRNWPWMRYQVLVLRLQPAGSLQQCSSFVSCPRNTWQMPQHSPSYVWNDCCWHFSWPGGSIAVQGREAGLMGGFLSEPPMMEEGSPCTQPSSILLCNISLSGLASGSLESQAGKQILWWHLLYLSTLPYSPLQKLFGFADSKQ